MNQKLQGIVIRKRRQELGWSQAALCSGVCAVSYLSRIEQGQVEGSEEVMGRLFRRLDIRWQEDPAFCRETGDWFGHWYDRLFLGEEISEIGPVLAQRREEYRSSPFFLDWVLLTWVLSDEQPEDVEEFLPAMDDRQRSLYLCQTDRFRELLRESDRSYFLMRAGKRAEWLGDYDSAVNFLQNGMERAYREGSLIILMQCCAYLANCYGGLDQLGQARKYYAVAVRMAQSLGRQEDLKVISYNRSTIELQMGLAEEPLRHLLEQPWDVAVYFHKLAICYERLGRKEEARVALEQTLQAPLIIEHLGAKSEDQQLIEDIFRQMCRLVEFRLEDPNYLKSRRYGADLCSCVENIEKYFPLGFLHFHVCWLEEWYTANRQYRKAYDILRRVYRNGQSGAP